MNVIEVSGLSKTFAGVTVVDDVNLTVKQGEVFGFLGPNGSGKTTTIRMLCGLLTPDAGQGKCLGHDVLSQSSQIKAQVGYMPQTFSLYGELSILENLNFCAQVYGVAVPEVAIQHAIEQFELAPRLQQRMHTLSGGWKQRVTLAACLLHQPKLLLLDEPTAGVDPKARRDFWDTIHQLAQQGITTLVSTHYMDEAERCTRLAYIVNGKLLTTGSHEQVIEGSGLHTWQVEGDNLSELARSLSRLPGVEQIARFGRRLHVCGKNKSLLNKTLKAFQQDQIWQWQASSASLEDVFIYLVDQHKHEVADG